MNIKRLILAIIVAFVVLWATDFLIHGIWMMPDYRATQSLWRPEAEMGSYMGWMLGAQLLFVITVALVWAKGFASSTTKISCAIGYGLGDNHVRRRTHAVFHRDEMVLCRYRADHSTRPRHLLDLQALGTGDRNVIWAVNPPNS
jgi:hypothetical protein